MAADMHFVKNDNRTGLALYAEGPDHGPYYVGNRFFYAAAFGTRTKGVRQPCTPGQLRAYRQAAACYEATMLDLAELDRPTGRDIDAAVRRNRR